MAKNKQKKVRISDRMQALMDGTMDITELDDEEVRRGQVRSASGDFRGRPADYVPRKLHNMLVEEHVRRWNLKVAQELDPALEALKEIAAGNHRSKTPADARMKSAIYLIERTAGKVPEKVEARVEVAKWEEDIEALLYEAGEDTDEAAE